MITRISTSSHPPQHASFAVFVTPSGEVLFESSRKHGGLHAVGGKAKRKETPFSALVREVKEEIGHRVRIGDVSEIRSQLATYGDEQWYESYFVIPCSRKSIRELCEKSRTVSSAAFEVRPAWSVLSSHPLSRAGRQGALIALDSLLLKVSGDPLCQC